MSFEKTESLYLPSITKITKKSLFGFNESHNSHVTNTHQIKPHRIYMPRQHKKL